MPVLVEAAVDSLADVLDAEGEGVQRIELCGPLHDGGTTPAADLVARAVASVRTPIHVLIRPRAGDFVYDAGEIDRMEADVAAAKALGAAGVVIGALTSDGEIDTDTVAALVALARPMHVGFHRTFDHVRDQFEALEMLVSLHVDLVLTSGGAPTAQGGADRLRGLVDRAGDRIGIIGAGSITPANVRDLVERTGVRQVHGRAFRGLPAAVRGV
jgi:copper homeostasis protein